jgi:uncharacterized protein (TIGR03067 family)
MKLALPTLVALAIFGMTTEAPGEEAKGDAQKIQGDWIAIYIALGGSEQELPSGDERKLKITADKMEPTVNGPGTTCKLGVENGLTTIDSTTKEGKTLKGIYELHGNLLILCFPLRHDADRPKDISSAGKRVLTIMKREKR